MGLRTEMLKILSCYRKGTYQDIHKATDKIIALMLQNDKLEDKIAAATAHRACLGVEHAPENGRVHGDCIVCGVPWPCETASKYLSPKEG